MARTVFSPTHPVRLIASTMLQTTTELSDLAEAALRRLREFFQDSIGCFHQETIALLQTHASALMNREQYVYASVRYRQLLEAFEIRHGKHSYEACYALRALAVFFYNQGLHETRHAERLRILGHVPGPSSASQNHDPCKVPPRHGRNTQSSWESSTSFCENGGDHRPLHRCVWPRPSLHSTCSNA